jgi:predicted RNA-binding Zn-ribbon protein involved in translation (DUF1610 family)
MASWVEATKSYADDDIRIDCLSCGIPLRIQITKQAGHNEPEECHCPGCGHEMTFRASLTPIVTRM